LLVRHLLLRRAISLAGLHTSSDSERTLRFSLSPSSCSPGPTGEETGPAADRPDDRSCAELEIAAWALVLLSRQVAPLHLETVRKHYIN
jgi:hypothetical protein